MVQLLTCYTCWTTVIFKTLKDGCLEINSLALNSCFGYRNVMSSTLCQKWFKKNGFFFTKKLKIRVVWTKQFCSNFTSMWSKYLSNNVWRDLRLPMSALAIAGESLNTKFAAKIDFPIGHFMLPLPMLTLEVWSPSIHYLVSIWSTYWWNLNKSYGPNYTKFWAFWQKMVNHFWQSVDAILEDVSVTETIVWC